jgi:sulfate permease, SulP family
MYSVQETPKLIKNYIYSSINYYRTNPLQLKTELLSGIAVAIMQVPESIAFAFIAEVSPLQGLYSTFFIGLFTAAFGGRAGMISGIAGAMVVVFADMQKEMKQNGLCETDRYELMLVAIIACGIFEIVGGMIQVHRIFMLLPQTIAVGFVNGLAVIIFNSQLGAFKVDDINTTIKSLEPEGCPASLVTSSLPQRWLMLSELKTWLILIMVAVVMAIMFLQPRITKSFKIGKVVISSKIIPASLTSMIVATMIEHLLYRLVFKVSTKTVGDVAKLKGSLPVFYVPQFNFENLPIAIRYGGILAAVAITENLLTLQLVSEVLKKKLFPYQGFQELVAQGVGCIFSGFFQSIGGNTMIGQSIVNVLNGSHNRLAGILASFLILLLIGVAGPAIELLPVASLTGILFFIVIHTFEWRIFKYLYKRQARIFDFVTILLVTVMAVLTNLAYAVFSGLIWSVCVFALQASTSLKIQKKKHDSHWIHDHIPDVDEKSEYLHYKISGLLFFGSVRSFVQDLLFEITQTFDSKGDCETTVERIVVLDCEELEIFDFSAIEGFKRLVTECKQMNVRLYLIHVHEHSHFLMKRHSKLNGVMVTQEVMMVVVNGSEEVEEELKLNSATRHNIIEEVKEESRAPSTIIQVQLPK